MDNSTNIIDLEYLVNPCYTVKIPEKKIEKIYTVNQEELDFYKRRIFQLTRELLLGKRMNTKINDSFHGFARVCIEYFKFIDKSDTIQEDYIHLPIQKNNKATFFNLNNTDKKLLQKKPIQQDIASMLRIRKKTKPVFMPKQRKMDLKNEKFKNKGVPKNNLTNNYENKKNKKKKEKNTKTEGGEKKRKRKKKKNCVKVEI